MTQLRQCPIPTRGGRDCWETPHPDSKLGLCARHWRIAAEGMESGSPLTDIRCRYCGQIGMVSVARDHIAYCRNRECGQVIFDVDFTGRELITIPEPPPVKTPTAQPSVVYYILWADRIKIGTSFTLTTRLKSLYFDQLLAIEPGNHTLESRRHREFASLKLPNYREWFQAAAPLIFHTNTLRDKYGAPMEALRLINAKRAA